ncbi:cobalt-precorrin-5B (C(1))-methyltransferase CbiD [Limnofasciculus baicalensis]|uniref:Cobalt-precorrin-5B C(1)-methyltransferase n=1 Tax=Limnofasciculus baicalensis BBK-W-15 TaxID=2699891 RepID=A0AAE3KKJ0_9CYAN|nr:cobalt-precorrin-5B (C(1))-methyltransferase CbiD [Limnofasciculus baicalensis]MCP2727605.1 cobalt-precorrin-5B (C(1))-methyltransferase CbiD [Limnofasciculus baicalensis BBK-W-15]
MTKSGYTLPVFATAAAIAAFHWLRKQKPLDTVSVNLIQPPEIAEIPIQQVAGIREGMALAITRSNPGDNLDMTRNTPIWAVVEWGNFEQKEQVQVLGGEGVGRQLNRDGKAAIYSYAQKLIPENLTPLLKPTEKIQVTIILPEGRKLAERTSNAAFGVVEGLSLLGTTGISQPLSNPAQLEVYREELAQKASKLLVVDVVTDGATDVVTDVTDVTDGGIVSIPSAANQAPSTTTSIPSAASSLVFCVGENGLDLARQMGIPPERLVKTANWLGPLLVEAGLQKVPAILLFGYHGKLIKVAGGIFHTHHHLADGRLEILTAHCAKVGLPTPVLQAVFASPTTDAALKYLRELDATDGSNWVERVYGAIAVTIDLRCQDYIRKHSEQEVLVGSLLFDRNRQIIVTSATGVTLLSQSS